MRSARTRRGFTLIDLAVVLVIALLLLLLPGLMKQRWNASGLDDSLNNVRQILAATAQYRADNAGRVPMRACGYNQGVITTGWDTWAAFGKNCDIWWQSGFGGSFDDSAYSRPLNPYLTATAIPVPPGYVNTGSGTTTTGNPGAGLWTFNDGFPTAQQRASFELKKCRSPGDVSTRQRNWPSATPGVSCYNDIGTSYMFNMKWWSQPVTFPSNFTLRYDAGTGKIRTLPLNKNADRAGETFVWMSDQFGELVADGYNVAAGEFGGANMSVLGFLSGSAAYKTLTVNSYTGPGYTWAIPWP